jgi:hypothetical protein
MPGISLHKPHGPSVRVREDGLRPEIADDVFPSIGNPPDRIFPGKELKFPAPFGTGAPEGGGEAERGMDRPLIVIHFGAKRAPGKGMVRVPRNFDRFPVHHFNQKPAGIRAVIWAHRSHDLSSHKDLLKIERKLEYFYFILFPPHRQV